MENSRQDSRRKTKNCPERGLLEKYCNDDVSDEMLSSIELHVRECPYCREYVRRLRTDDLDLPAKLLEQEIYSRSTQQDYGPHYSLAGLLAHLTGCCTPESSLQMESHLTKCEYCQARLQTLRESTQRSADVELNENLYREDMAHLVLESHKFLALMLKAREGVLELLTHTGTLLFSTTAGAVVRGEQAPGFDESIAVKKELAGKDISVEIDVEKAVHPDGVNMRVSVMRVSTEEFPSGLSIVLQGEKTVKRTETDPGGVVEFLGIPLGIYDVTVDSDLAARIVIK
jgi:glutaredoxin